MGPKQGGVDWGAVLGAYKHVARSQNRRLLRADAVVMPQLTTGFKDGTDGRGRLSPDVLAR